MYANGVGVHPDKVTAYMWHLLAEFAGETRSRIARSQLDPTMTADQKSEANARASQWLRRHRQLSDRVSLPARQMKLESVHAGGRDDPPSEREKRFKPRRVAPDRDKRST